MTQRARARDRSPRRVPSRGRRTATSARPSAPRTSSRAAAASPAGRSRPSRRRVRAAAGGRQREERRREEEGGADEGGRGGARDAAGQALKEKVLNDPLVKAAKDAITSPVGIAVTGTAIAGGVAALGATGKELPFQPPAIPLDKITPGLSAQITYQGPVNAPTFVGLTLSYKEQGPKGKGKPADDPRAKEAAAAAAFQRTIRYAPGSKEAEEQRLSEQAVAAYVTRTAGLPGLTFPLTPPPKKDEEKTPPAPVQPAPASTAKAPPAHANVDGALSSPGRPLDAPARRSMEARFGYDFSNVRIHDDARAAATASSIDAAAFTVGDDIAFAPGRYDPRGEDGKRLLAHELAHVAQQQQGRVPRKATADARPLPESTRRELEERFGEPLDDVRVHTGAEGRRVAGNHSALAVARGSELFFASGAWAPGTDLGNRLLRHEVAHLVQARRSGAAWPEPVLEAEAQLAARAPGAFGVRGRAAPRAAAARQDVRRDGRWQPGLSRERRQVLQAVGGRDGDADGLLPGDRRRPREGHLGADAVPHRRPRQPVQPLPAAPDGRVGERLRQPRRARASDPAAARDGARKPRACDERRDGPGLQLALEGQGGGAPSHAARAQGGADRDAAGVRLVGRRRALRRERQGIGHRHAFVRRRPDKPPGQGVRSPGCGEAPRRRGAPQDGDEGGSRRAAHADARRVRQGGLDVGGRARDDQGEARPLLAAGHGRDPARGKGRHLRGPAPGRQEAGQRQDIHRDPWLQRRQKRRLPQRRQGVLRHEARQAAVDLGADALPVLRHAGCARHPGGRKGAGRRPVAEVPLRRDLQRQEHVGPSAEGREQGRAHDGRRARGDPALRRRQGGVREVVADEAGCRRRDRADRVGDAQGLPGLPHDRSVAHVPRERSGARPRLSLVPDPHSLDGDSRAGAVGQGPGLHAARRRGSDEALLRRLDEVRSGKDRGGPVEPLRRLARRRLPRPEEHLLPGELRTTRRTSGGCRDGWLPRIAAPAQGRDRADGSRAPDACCA